MTVDNSDNMQNSSLARSVKAVLLLQTVAAAALMLVTAIFGFYFWGSQLHVLLANLIAILFGSLLAMAATMLTARSVRRASPAGDDKVQPGQAPVSLVPIFSGLLNKLVIVGGGIAFGLIVWDLSPIFVVLSYLVVQIAAAGHLMQNSVER